MKEVPGHKILSEEEIYRGRIATVKKYEIELEHNGMKTFREEISQPSSVAIVGITEEGKIPLVKQVRFSAGGEMIELPAGRIDEGENPKDSAKRELQEETGYTSEEFELLYEGYSSPGITNEKVHIFLATNLQKGDQDLQDDEKIDVKEYTPDELHSLFKKGFKTSLFTIIGCQEARKYLDRVKAQTENMVLNFSEKDFL